jgi:hypothetical protein
MHWLAFGLFTLHFNCRESEEVEHDERLRENRSKDREERYRLGCLLFMTKLEDLRPNASVQGILPNCPVTVINTQWFGSQALELT